MMNDTMVARRLRAAMVVSMGGEPGRLGAPGTTAVADVARQGSQRIACYQFGRHTMLFSDPEVIGQASELEGGEPTSDARFREWAAACDGVVLGQSIMKVAGPGGLVATTMQQPCRRLRWSDPDDLVLMQGFVDASEPDDLDEAEVAMDDLDDLAVAVFSDDGAIGAYASARLFEEDPSFGDIGIATAPHARRLGYGATAVSALAADVLLPAAIEPLYRCDPANIGSDRLSASLGFEPALSLTVIELPVA